jgi:hypothetical protein
MVAASTKRLHSAHPLVLDGYLLIGDRQLRAARLAGYVFLPGKGGSALAGAGMKRAAGATSFLGCLGFLCSRLLRCSPLGIRVLLK